MKPSCRHLLKLTCIGLFLCAEYGCERTGGCPFPGGLSQSKSRSFALGYRGQADTLLFNLISYKTVNPISYHSPEPIFNLDRIFQSTHRINSNDSMAISLVFEIKESINSHPKRSDLLRKDELSRQNGDTNFNRIISVYTINKNESNGRIVLEDAVSTIKVRVNGDYMGYTAGDDVSSAFVLAYTDPIRVSQNNASFTEAGAGDYVFLKFGNTEEWKCAIPGESFHYDSDKGMCKIDRPAPFQWYDGEYFPSVIYQKLTEVPFSEIKHLSAMAALIPTVYPNESCEVSFTIEVHFSNGKILSNTTPMMIFSGL